MTTAAPAPTATPGQPDEPRLLSVAHILEEWEADAVAAHAAYCSSQPRGAKIAFPRLAAVLGTAWPPGLHILHGQPGTGKTAFALQVAAEAECPALYLTAEMTPLELVRRLVARLSGEYLGRFKSGEFTPEQSLAYARAALAKVPHLVVADATRSWASPAWLRDHADAVRRDHPSLLIVVDSLHSWAEGAAIARGSEYDILNAGIAALRQLGDVLACSILAIAERNRLSMSGGGLSAGAGTRKIEYGAEAVLDLTCDQELRRDARGERPVALKVVKNRNGDLGTCDLAFHGALQRFRPV